ncbi:MAG: SDR family NAD(P)-dependent oxidoreductase [Betaproteobacteria bacterium]
MFAGRVALVTGGGRGIGLAIVRVLHEAGGCVVIADNGTSIGGDGADPTVATGLAAALGERAAAFTADISDDAVAEGAVRFALERFGNLDIVVNNAAILRDGFIFKTRRDDWEQVLRVNLMAPLAVLAAASPALREQAKGGRTPGRIVNIVSSAGLIGNLGQSAYASAKAGLVGLTRVVAMDLARSGITCNALAPFAATRVTESIQPANEAQAQYKARALSVPADYVARVAASLCADANRFTGQIFGVRGREVFLFSQPRPAARLVAPKLADADAAALGAALASAFVDQSTSLATDLELFNTEPVL